jgi:hypothetical protein
MTHHASTPRRSSGLAALGVTAAVAAALAGCKSSASGAGQSGPAASASAAAASGGSGSSGGSAGSDYFPVAQGNTWVYKSSVLSGLTSKAIVTNKIIRVVPVTDGKKVTMRTVEPGLATFNDTYVFHSDGSVSVPFGSIGGTGVKVDSGGGVYWPSVAGSAPGTTRRSTLRLSGGDIGHVTAHITVTSGGSKTVTVPAGTYNARAVIETIREKAAGHTVSVKLVTYLAAGVGPVKTVMDGSVGEVLKSFTRG